MLALVAMRFLGPACLALIVSLPDTKPVPFRSRPRGSRAPLHTATNLAPMRLPNHATRRSEEEPHWYCNGTWVIGIAAVYWPGDDGSSRLAGGPISR